MYIYIYILEILYTLSDDSSSCIYFENMYTVQYHIHVHAHYIGSGFQESSFLNQLFIFFKLFAVHHKKDIFSDYCEIRI